MTLISKLWKKLATPAYRHGLTASQVKEGIAFQIKALRKQQELTQAQLAERSDLDQSSISRAENPESVDQSVNTLLAIAEGFDVGLICEFVPYSEMVDRFDRLPGKRISTFKEESTGGSPPDEESHANRMDVRLPPQQARAVESGSTFGKSAKVRTRTR